MRPKFPTSLILATTLPMMMFFLGCGSSDTPELAPVTGTVTLGGEPLPDARITFTPKEEGSISQGKTDENGEYELIYSREEKGAMIGEHEVTITTYREPGSDGGEGIPEKVPAKYNVNTELVKTVEAGGSVIDFELEAEGEIIEPTKDQ